MSAEVRIESVIFPDTHVSGSTKAVIVNVVVDGPSGSAAVNFKLATMPEADVNTCIVRALFDLNAWAQNLGQSAAMATKQFQPTNK